MKRILALALLAAFCAAPVAHAEDGPVSATATPPAAAKDGDKKPNEKKDAKKDEGKKEEGGEAKKAPADISGGRFAGDPIYVHLAPIILPVISKDGAEQIVTLQIAVEIRDFNSADNMHTNMPRVNDALMRALYGGLGNGNLRDGQLVNVAKIKAKAIQAIGEVIGPENVRDVLIEAVAQRKL